MKNSSSFLLVSLLLLASFTVRMENPRGDVNYDGKVTISDVTCLIDYLLSGNWSDEPVVPPNDSLPDNPEWVDLGLPSGTLWATRNIGANSPEDYGDYFAWGEIEPKEIYNWSTYKWCSGSVVTLKKYCTQGNYGTVDNKTELDPEDDAAYVNWGSSWRMPSADQQQELCDKCTWQWVTKNGVNGCLVIGPNGKTLFLPAAGWRYDNALNRVGSSGDYWSRTLGSGLSNGAYRLIFRTGNIFRIGFDLGSRTDGFPVRAVRVSEGK